MILRFIEFCVRWITDVLCECEVLAIIVNDIPHSLLSRSYRS